MPHEFRRNLIVEKLNTSIHQPAGILMPIGGAEDKKNHRTILRHFVQLSGGKHARIVIIPSASAYAIQTAATYTKLFTQMGVLDVHCLHLGNQREAQNLVNIKRLKNATGIFITGGDQVRLMGYLQGTPVGMAILHAYRKGAVIAGTSAGASAMSQKMIAFSYGSLTPNNKTVHLGTGLGLAPSVIIDQHFSQRQRLARLLLAVQKHPGHMGLGIDEDTAAVITPGNGLEIIGSGSVTVVDNRRASEKPYIRVLQPGIGYNLHEVPTLDLTPTMAVEPI
jgi:cyanophycinase